MYGDALLTRTRAVFDELRQGIKDIEFLADPTGGEVRIGCSVAASVTFLRPIIRGFSEAHPGAALRVEDVPAAGWELGLRERTHDLLLQWFVPPYSSDLPAGEVKVEPLFDDHLVAVAGPQTRWAGRRKIDLAELVGERWILGPPGTANYAGITEALRARGRHAESRFGDPLGAASNLLSCLRSVHRGYAAVARVPIAGKNIACRVVGSAVAVCDIHAEESDREPCGRPLHRAGARVHPADAGEETRRISDEIVHLLVGVAAKQGRHFGLDGLRQKRSRAVAQDLGQRVRKSFWLGELENVSIGLGVSLLQGRSGGFRTPPRYAALSPHAVTNFRA